eukprot:TRINITY_DN25686_c0_g1_i1.p1 TRINITY_DN25686_c0_g1~~TRINITY_DN25686_c0_g1_i1.p1  ORF type:complete len:211 (-),score=42.58 TRINITY_DN25686_c0_g1_i1:84-716(-)
MFKNRKTAFPLKAKKGHVTPKHEELHTVSQETLGSGNLKAAVKLPKNEELNDWLAVHVVDFYNQINMLYATISEFCTDEKCPQMNAGSEATYLWADGDKIKKPIECSAPAYIDYLMEWATSIMEDSTIFPSTTDQPFPKHFHSTVKRIFKRFFRVFAHMYRVHFQDIESLGEVAHINTMFKHFALFVTEFNLIDIKDMSPLEERVNKILE